MKKPIFAFLLVLFLVTFIYFPTLQTIINGSSDDLMNDSGEIQVALNTWGTIHAPGYPFFTIVGNLFVSVLRAARVDPAAAPALFALLSGVIALGLIYALALHLTARVELAASLTVLFALTRDAWIHNVIAETYSLALVFQVLLLLIALWQREIPHRLEWLAFIGGLGIAHHRGLILSIPPIVYAVYPQLKTQVMQNPRKIFLLLVLGLLGFLPYIYLPLRAWMHASWVYGNPGTLGGLWDQFIAREAPGIVSLPDSLQTLAGKFDSTNTLLEQELTRVGIVVGVLGLIAAIYNPARRRAGITLLISALTAYAFMVLLFNDILAPIVFHITLPLAFGWLLLADALGMRRRIEGFARIALVSPMLILAAFLMAQNFYPIYSLTHDPTGIETIQVARSVPAGSTLVLEWGTRYYAVAFAQEVLGELTQFQRADDKADLPALAARSPIVTFDYAMYDLGIGWWEKKMERSVYLHAAGPHLVQIDLAPKLLTASAILDVDALDPSFPVAVLDQSLDCGNDAIVLQVDWVALTKPSRDLSVFVHLQDRDGRTIAQADQGAPVYGWRPLTTWVQREIVHDVYPLRVAQNAARLEFGFYERKPNGEFINYSVRAITNLCESGAR